MKEGLGASQFQVWKDVAVDGLYFIQLLRLMGHGQARWPIRWATPSRRVYDRGDRGLEQRLHPLVWLGPFGMRRHVC
jgi:hypothetical protein